jgi:predicted dehydrogenase
MITNSQGPSPRAASLHTNAMRPRPLRGALIGYGFIGGLGHLPAYRARTATRGDVEIVAAADTCPARLADAASRYPDIRLYSDARSLLEAEAAGLDFVDICTPPCDHAALAMEALSAGLHVLCEKPLTTSFAEADALLAHAARCQRVLYPCHNYLHAPVVRAIRTLLDDQLIGTLRTVALSTMRNTHAKGVTEWNTHWRRHQAYSGGGIVMDHGSHSFYLLFDWFGAYPEAVTAKVNTLDRGYDTEDNASVVLTFPNGMATVQLSWTAGVRKVQYALHGERGAITVDDDDLQLSQMRRTDGPDIAQGAVRWDVDRRSIASHWGDASHTTWFDTLFSQFADAVQTGTWVSDAARDAHQCIAVIEAAYASSRQGSREVALADVLRRDLAAPRALVTA